MGVTEAHYSMVRAHFKYLLGGECVECGTVFNLEFHHTPPSDEGMGRGRSARMWNLFASFATNSLVLLCKDCHHELHFPSKEE